MNAGLFNFRGARPLGISEQQQDDEIRAQRRLTAAVSELRRAIEDVNASSVVVEIEPSALEDFVTDELPAPIYWDEKLSDGMDSAHAQ